jgi:hypothetical protein
VTFSDFQLNHSNRFEEEKNDILIFPPWHLRNKSWKPECVLSFNMGWWILVFYPEPEEISLNQLNNWKKIISVIVMPFYSIVLATS